MSAAVKILVTWYGVCIRKFTIENVFLLPQRSLFQDTKKNKKLAVPLTFVVPQSAVTDYDVEHVANKMAEIFQALQVMEFQGFYVNQ